MRFVGTNIQVDCDDFHNLSAAEFPDRRLSKRQSTYFQRRIAVSYKTKKYKFILPSKTCQRHVETSSSNDLDLVQCDQLPFDQSKLLLQELNK